MNRKYLIIILSINTLNLATDLFTYIADGIEDSVGIYRPNNITTFKQFKTNIDQINAQISQQIAINTKQASSQPSNQLLTNVQELQKQQSELLNTAKKSLDEHDYYILQKSVQDQRTLVTDLLDNWEILTAFWEKYALSFLQKAANQDNPYKDKSALVTQGDSLSDDEQLFLQKRMPIAQKSVATFLGTSLKQPISIGYAAPGGGYRAMILTSGYLRALEDLGLLDAVLYSSALSGSTWFQLPWIFSQMNVADFQQTLITKIKNKQLNPVTDLLDASGSFTVASLNSLVNALWPKFLFNQQLSSVDVYGTLLAQVLLSPEQRKLHLTNQWDKVKNGLRPFPIYNAVSITNSNDPLQNYFWNEFNPLEIRNLDLQLSIPTYAFGSEFDAGKSKLIAPEQSVGYLMGTYGSAYLIDLLDIDKILSDLRNAAHKAGHDQAARYLIAATLINLINLVPITYKQMRLLPSLTNNPFKNSTFANLPPSLKSATKLLFADAGIAYNIPGRPLLRKSRGLNVLIIGDTSGDLVDTTQMPPELEKFFRDAQKVFGYNYTQVDDNRTPTLKLYKDMKNPQAPRIIYFNFMKDPNLIEKGMADPTLAPLITQNNLSQFDYNCIAVGGYCNTFNFQYMVEQFKQLSGIAEFNIKINGPTVKKFLLDEFLSKP